MVKNIWDQDEDTKPVTEQEIKHAETSLGVTLPTSYIDLCKIHNGGYLIYNAFPTSVETTWAEDHISGSHLYGINEEGILQTEYMLNEWDLPKGIVLIDGEGHSWIALDYREQKENPPVVYLEEGEEMEWREIVLAASFEEYISKLYTHDDKD